MVSLSKWGNQDETHSSGRELLPFWRSKRPAHIEGIDACGSCHNVVVTTDGVPFPQEMPKNKRFGLASTFWTVILCR